MKILELYKYERPEGGTIVSLIKPECEYEQRFRLVAEDNMVLFKNNNDDIRYKCIDVDSLDGWNEIGENETMKMLDMKAALNLLGVFE